LAGASSSWDLRPDLPANIDLYGSRIGFSDKRFKRAGWTTNTDIAIRLRALRSLTSAPINRRRMVAIEFGM
jgi:hypothetical protein